MVDPLAFRTYRVYARVPRMTGRALMTLYLSRSLPDHRERVQLSILIDKTVRTQFPSLSARDLFELDVERIEEQVGPDQWADRRWPLPSTPSSLWEKTPTTRVEDQRWWPR